MPNSLEMTKCHVMLKERDVIFGASLEIAGAKAQICARKTAHCAHKTVYFHREKCTT